MAREVRAFSVTIPPGTLTTAPVATQTTFPVRIVEAIEVLVPPGPNGLVGFAIRNAGQQVIPYGAAQWVIASGEKIDWPLEQFIESGAWSVLGYNLGVYPHTLQVRYLLQLAGDRGPLPLGGPIGNLAGTLS